MNTVSGEKRKAPGEGHRTMGFQMTGDGSLSAHTQVMTDKLAMYAATIQRSSLWKG
jgi:hypothetical protein